jgi:hypothetical protein
MQRADIGLRGDRRSALGADLGDHRVRLCRGVEMIDHHLHAGRGEIERDRLPDAGGRAGDDGDLAGQPGIGQPGLGQPALGHSSNQ